MKNFEKHIDEIATFVGYSYEDCDQCPCKHECWNDDTVNSCIDFFKQLALKEVEE